MAVFARRQFSHPVMTWWRLVFAPGAMSPGTYAAAMLGVLWLVVLAVLSGCEGASEQSAATTAGTAGAVSRPAPVAAPAYASPPGALVFRAPPRAGATGATAIGGGTVMLPAGPERHPDASPQPVQAVKDQAVSTFSIDVDTASYAVARRFLREGRLPPRAAIRVEEMVNYFPYGYAGPGDRSQPFRVATATFPAPWNAETKLLHIAIKGFDLSRAARPRANLVLLIDVSGSMTPSDRLPLLKDAFRLFVQEMRDEDRVAIVTYANGVRTVLEPTEGRERAHIVEAIEGLHAGVGTAGSDGIQRAYALAERHFDREAVNRVILATDGDFNLGITDPKRLEDYVAGKRQTGIYLTILGVGLGNLNDALMQRLAQTGNGNAAYIDSLLEARKVLIEELASTVFPIANDVKIQVEFNPALVAEYRLIGYETRMLRREDFKNDRVDAGDIGAGHTVTALYEVVPVASRARLIDPLRYQPEGTPSQTAAGEYAFVRLRYKRPGEGESRLIEMPVSVGGGHASLGAAPSDLRFAAAVAAFGQLLRGDPYLANYGFDDVAALADGARGTDAGGYRAEFMQLVRLAKSLKQIAGP